MPTSALHVARTGLEAQDARMRVIANNLANIGTTAFKRDRADFATLAYQEQRVAGQQSTGQTAYAVGLNLGTGVQVQGTSRIEAQGTLNTTGNAFDVALDGPGYFQVELPPGGQVGFTRAGNFTLNNDAQLVTQEGRLVLDVNNQPITIAAEVGDAVARLGAHIDARLSGFALDPHDDIVGKSQNERAIDRFKVPAIVVRAGWLFRNDAPAQPARGFADGIEDLVGGPIENHRLDMWERLRLACRIGRAGIGDRMGAFGPILGKSVELGRMLGVGRHVIEVLYF